MGRRIVFFVRYTKFQTVDERRSIMEESRWHRATFRNTLPEAVRHDLQTVSRVMMQAQFDDGAVYG